MSSHTDRKAGKIVMVKVRTLIDGIPSIISKTIAISECSIDFQSQKIADSFSMVIMQSACV